MGCVSLCLLVGRIGASYKIDFIRGRGMNDGR